MSDGGKGSAPRPFSVDQETFASNWDRIFKKNDYQDIVSTEDCVLDALDKIQEVSSVGRASPLQGECHRFEPGTSYQDKKE